MSRLAVLVACLGFVVPSSSADETATGVVYVDANGNGRKDADERPDRVDFLIGILEDLRLKYPWTREDAKNWWLRFKG